MRSLFKDYLLCHLQTGLLQCCRSKPCQVTADSADAATLGSAKGIAAVSLHGYIPFIYKICLHRIRVSCEQKTTFVFQEVADEVASYLAEAEVPEELQPLKEALERAVQRSDEATGIREALEAEVRAYFCLAPVMGPNLVHRLDLPDRTPACNRGWLSLC